MRLQVEDVCFSYPGKAILHDFSFQCEGGEFVGLVGPNGTGKTTLIKCISGLHRPSSGRIWLDGQDLSALSMKQRAQKIGYVPQDTGTNFSITVMNAVLLGRTPYIRSGASEKDVEIAEKAIRQMGLESLAFSMINELSGGERQRALVARALAQQPELLVLDEPTSSLDLRHQLETLEIVGNVAKEEGLLVILSIHDLNLAGRFASRLLMLKQGSLFADGTPAQVITPENIETVYRVKAAVRYENGRPFVFPERILEKKVV